MDTVGELKGINPDNFSSKESTIAKDFEAWAGRTFTSVLVREASDFDKLSLVRNQGSQVVREYHFPSSENNPTEFPEKAQLDIDPSKEGLERICFYQIIGKDFIRPYDKSSIEVEAKERERIVEQEYIDISQSENEIELRAGRYGSYLVATYDKEGRLADFEVKAKTINSIDETTNTTVKAYWYSEDETPGEMDISIKYETSLYDSEGFKWGVEEGSEPPEGVPEIEGMIAGHGENRNVHFFTKGVIDEPFVVIPFILNIQGLFESLGVPELVLDKPALPLKDYPVDFDNLDKEGRPMRVDIDASWRNPEHRLLENVGVTLKRMPHV